MRCPHEILTPRKNPCQTCLISSFLHFFTGEAASLFRAAALARLRALFVFCAIFASLLSCSSAFITSASALETRLPLITLKPGVAGILGVAAAAAAAERRVTRGVKTTEACS